jgi:hypothetical protein
LSSPKKKKTKLAVEEGGVLHDEERTPSPPRFHVDAIPSAPTPVADAIPTSPWDPLFNPELFLEKMVAMSGGSSCFGSTSTDELIKMSLGHELKGLLLNYALAARQRGEVASAKERLKVVDDNLVQIEKEYTETKDKLSKDIQDQKTDYNRRVEELKKEQETAVEKLKADHAAAIKRLEEASVAKDGQIAELLREKASWIEEKDGLKDSIGL